MDLVYTKLFIEEKKTKINSEFGSWEEILLGLPQGSGLGPLIFNNLICFLQ